MRNIEEIAKLVHVDGLLKRYPSELSGGQQQRVAIARALIKNPALLLMDEPLSNLDARLRLEMREEIRRIQQETGVTTVFVTHDQEEAMSISDSIVLMKNGVLVQSGLSQELYNNPNCKFVADFLGNPPVNQLKLNAEQLKIISETVGFNLTDISEKDVTVAIRTESFTDTNSLEAEVVSVSEMGKEQIVNLKLFDNTVRAILNTDKTYVSGNKISIGLKKKGIFVFDEKTGKRLV